MRVAVLWSSLSGYLNCCLRELAAQPGVELFVVHKKAGPDAPFSDEQFAWMKQSFSFTESADERALLRDLSAFGPDLLLVSGWTHSAYRAACELYRGKAARIMCVDTQWEGRAKQWIGVITSPLFIKRLFDGVFVPGERQADFARRLGFTQDQILCGVLAGDHDAFAAVHKQRINVRKPVPEGFVFVGRLAPEKGIDTLAAAYRVYRQRYSSPWPLTVVGTGRLKNKLEDVPGVQFSGFVQPDALPRFMAEAGCLVMPSLREPWGVAIHEACAAGLPVICSSVCGAAVHLVQDGYNGYLTEAGDVESLATAMQRISNLDRDRRAAMSEASYMLSLQFTPARWARCVVEHGMEVLSCSAALGQKAQ